MHFRHKPKTIKRNWMALHPVQCSQWLWASKPIEIWSCSNLYVYIIFSLLISGIFAMETQSLVHMTLRKSSNKILRSFSACEKFLQQHTNISQHCGIKFVSAILSRAEPLVSLLVNRFCTLSRVNAQAVSGRKVALCQFMHCLRWNQIELCLHVAELNLIF